MTPMLGGLRRSVQGAARTMPTLTRMMHPAPASAAAVRRLPASWKMAASGGRAFSKTTPLRLAAVADAGMH